VKLRRRGMALVEVLVVVALLVGITAISMPALDTLFQLEQRKVAKELTLQYGLLHDQAVMRNVTFRIAYHLDEGYYQIEVGDADTLIFDDPEKRIEYEEEQEDRLSAFTDEEDQPQESAFETLQDRFNAKRELPRGTVFRGVYTPQYGELVTASGLDIEVDPDDAVVVYSYIFGNGFSEHTIVQLMDEDDATSGYSVEVEPLSGRVTLFGEFIDHEDRFDFIPEEGPELEI
jgi:type II secretory pathway pseudopilin PulG